MSQFSLVTGFFKGTREIILHIFMAINTCKIKTIIAIKDAVPLSDLDKSCLLKNSIVLGTLPILNISLCKIYETSLLFLCSSLSILCSRDLIRKIDMHCSSPLYFWYPRVLYKKRGSHLVPVIKFYVSILLCISPQKNKKSEPLLAKVSTFKVRYDILSF